uniref:Uncharacterized protein n=1 Tax=Anguilla anguilla TaxID=7936 RepID=A0A0E9TW95_ANGAN
MFSSLLVEYNPLHYRRY